MNIHSSNLRQALEGLEMSDEQLRELTEAIAGRPPLAVRARSPEVARSLPFPSTPVAWHPRGRLLDTDAKPGSRLEYAAGDYYIQDAGSLLPLALLEVRPGELVCDLCAAPGGKSTGMLEELGEVGWLLSNEAIRARLPALEFNLARHGSPRFAVAQLDPEILAQRVGPIFDAVLVDAPCSGQTLLGRGKQSEASWSPRQIEHSAARQQRILDAAAQLVRPGGRLVYSTCTFAVAENERQLEAFLERHAGWQLDPAPSLAAWQSPRLPATYRLWPYRDPSAGAFAGRLRRDADGRPVVNTVKRWSERARKRGILALPENFDQWGTIRSVEVRGDQQRCFGWPESAPGELLNVAVSGPEIAFRKGSTWFPSYALAMRRDAAWEPVAKIPLDDDQASQYARGESLVIPRTGWGIATWHGRPLGWLKGNGRTARNHLPKPARLNTVMP